MLIHRGTLTKAEEVARGALDIAARTDDINKQGDCFARLAEVHAAAGRPEEAEAALGQALELYEHKGNLVAAEKVRRSLTDIAESRPVGA